jgi:hypothetical protein
MFSRRSAICAAVAASMALTASAFATETKTFDLQSLQRLSRKRRKRAHAGAPQAEADAAAKILGNQSLSDATYLLVHLLEIAMARARSAQGQEGHAVLGGHRRRENPLQDNELGRCGRDHSQSRLVWNPQAGRIDLADPQSVGALGLEVEETRISASPGGVEHREIRWRRATLPEAKMVLESYHAQQNLPMSATFMATAPAGTKRNQITFASSQELVVTRILPSAMRSNTTATLSALSNTTRV